MDNQPKKTGYDGAKAKAEELRGTKQPSELVTVEHRKDVALKRGIGIVGLEDMSTSIIPLPFYKMVSANSRNVNLADGTRAEPGTFYTDLGEEVENVRMAIIRSKHGTKEVKNNGIIKTEPTINILAVDTKNMSPFLISISKGSFSNYGRMMNWFIKNQAKHIFDYPVIMGSEFVEGKEFTYYCTTFNVEDKPFDQEDLETMAMVYNQYASTLDRNIGEEEETPSRPAQPAKQYNPDGSVKPTDSQGNVITDIPGTEENNEMPF